MGCRHRRVKKAVAAIKSARQSGNGAAVRRAVDTAKRLTGGAALRDSERELRRLVGQAGPSRRAAPRASSSAPARAEDAKAAAWRRASD